MQWRHASTSANHHTTLHNDNIFTHVNATVAIDHGCQSEFDMLRANVLIASIFTARLLHVYIGLICSRVPFDVIVVLYISVKFFFSRTLILQNVSKECLQNVSQDSESILTLSVLIGWVYIVLNDDVHRPTSIYYGVTKLFWD